MSEIIIRLKKIGGQINGIQKMIEKQDSCEKIITQFQAAKAALNSAFAKMLNENLNNCIKENNDDKMEKIVEMIVKK